MSLRWYQVGEAVYTDKNAAAVEHGRPVVVIDPEDREQVERLAAHIGHLWTTYPRVTEVVQAALREFANGAENEPEELPDGLVISSNGDLLNWRGENYVRQEVSAPKPPKPDEPTAKWSVVVDASGDQWVRALGPDFMDGWVRAGDLPSNGKWTYYADIDAVRVLSEGVVES